MRQLFDMRGMEAYRDEHIKLAHTNYSSWHSKIIDYIAHAGRTKCAPHETLNHIHHRSGHVVIYAEFEIREAMQRPPPQRRFGPKRGWRAADQETYKHSVETQLERCADLDDIVLSMEVTARSHESAPRRARPQGAETRVRDLLRARGEAATPQERRVAAMELHTRRDKQRWRSGWGGLRSQRHGCEGGESGEKREGPRERCRESSRDRTTRPSASSF